MFLDAQERLSSPKSDFGGAKGEGPWRWDTERRPSLFDFLIPKHGFRLRVVQIQGIEVL